LLDLISFNLMGVVGVMQGQYYLVWYSHYTIGQQLKVLQQNKVTASKTYMLGLYRHAVPNCPCTY